MDGINFKHLHILGGKYTQSLHKTDYWESLFPTLFDVQVQEGTSFSEHEICTF
jgi:hypothetical protein